MKLKGKLKAHSIKVRVKETLQKYFTVREFLEIHNTCSSLPHLVLCFLFQRQFRRKAGAEELQSPAGRPDVAFLWPLSGELLRPLCHMSGVC